MLEFNLVRYTGKISYGIYVYHPVVYLLLPILFYAIDVDFNRLSPLLQFGLLVETTLVIGALSWHLLESPINSLKNRFACGGPYVLHKEQRTQTVYLSVASGA